MGVISLSGDKTQKLRRINTRLAEINSRQARALAEIKAAELDEKKPAKSAVDALLALNEQAVKLREKQKAL